VKSEEESDLSTFARMVAIALVVGCGEVVPSDEDAQISRDAQSASDAHAPRRDASVFSNGDPGCGLEHAAFCDPFDAPSDLAGRAGELDPRRWSAARNAPQGLTGDGRSLAVGLATLPTCRDGLPARVLPDRDTLVCEGNEGVQSRHLLAAVAAQNYGQNSYRIRQPFDFEGRTGRIVFDAEAYMLCAGLGWISVEVTQDPSPAPSFGIFVNDEGGAIPRNAIEVQLMHGCAGWVEGPAIAVRGVHVFREHENTMIEPPQPTCLATEQGHLNHFEIALSQDRIEVYGTPASPDGLSFEVPQLIFAADVDLPFTRGYVHITTHNHATIKYSDGMGADDCTDVLHDAWSARWDNVGFDGPVIASYREHEVPDARAIDGDAMNLAYVLPASVTIPSVDPRDATRARLALNAYYEGAGGLPGTALLYRLNGRSWQRHALTEAEITALTQPIRNGEHANGNNGSIGQTLEVPVKDLIEGDNALELAVEGYDGALPVAVYNIDLVLATP
jgi:hypothetical protein